MRSAVTVSRDASCKSERWARSISTKSSKVLRVQKELLGLGGRGPEGPSSVARLAKALHDREQRQRAERLAEKKSVGTYSGDVLFGDLASGEKQDGHPTCGRIGFQRTAEIQPVDDRHGHVEDEHVGLSQLHLNRESGGCAVRFLGRG